MKYVNCLHFKVRLKLDRFAHYAEMDRAVFFGVMTKFWGLVTGPISMFLIATYFSPEIQGYYYTFSSLLALQTFVELGLGTVIQQFSSHEWAKLNIDHDGKIIGDPDALSRLSSIAKVGIRWFAVGGFLLMIGLGIGGFIFFSTSPDVNVNWETPWFALCVLTGITIFFQPLWSVLEGCNQVKRLYTFRFVQGVVSSIIGWSAMVLGAQLWTTIATSVAVVVCAVYFLSRYYNKFLHTLFFLVTDGPTVNWSRDLLPMQWRIAVSWISGYICFSLFTPVLFKYHGPVVAGQMGMTWTLVGTVGAIAGSWLSPRVPQFAMYVSECRYKELDHLFWRVTKMVILVSFLTALVVLLFVLAINWIDSPIADKLAARIFSPLTIAFFLLAQILLMSSVSFSSYMRAHKQEPVMLLSVIAAIMIGLSTIFLGKYYAGFGVAFGYLISLVIVIPFVFLIWYQCRRKWLKMCQ